jgi:translation initiation factor 2 subunit 1
MSRYYPKEIPEVGELVMASIDKQNEHGFLCSLLEYGGLEGYLPMSELSRKKIRTVGTYAKIGQQAIFQVLRVDGNYIDLSKKYVCDAERKLGRDKYHRSKDVYDIFKRVAELTEVDIQELYSRVVDPLYTNYTYDLTDVPDDDFWNKSAKGDFGNQSAKDTSLDADEESSSEAPISTETSKSHPYWALRSFLLDSNEKVFESIQITLKEKEELIKLLQRIIKVQNISCQAIIELTCYTFDGIDGIKRAWAKVKGSNDKISLKYMKAPHYCMTIVTESDTKGERSIKEAVKLLTEAMITEGGECKMVDIQYFVV